MITSAQLQTLFPATKKAILDKKIDPINKAIKRFKFDNSTAVCCFLAQIGHESGGFNYSVENLNYSAEGLLKIFPKYFNSSNVKSYARQPEKIANKVYANRMGNGNEASGDGWRFRGKGDIQITGRTNTENFAKFMELSVDDAIKYLLTPEGATMSAGWFFASNNLLDHARQGQMTVLTKRINGGLNGLSDRIDIYNRAKKLIKS